jgi:hypothetical protein
MATAREWIVGGLRRLPRRRGIPLSDADALRGALRRTTLVRLVLACALVVLAAVAVWRAASLNPRPVSFLPANSTTVVVLDQSKSVYIATYRRIAAMLRKLVAADVPVGLVAFSDTAYEMLPPGARGSELAPLLRFYTPGHGGSNVDPETLYSANPWQDVFSGGTKISAGLDMARSILHRDHIHNGTILLASDLETAGEDEPNLAQSLVQIGKDPQVHLRVIPLFPVEDDLLFFERFVPKGDFVKPAQLQVKPAGESRRRLVAGTPWPLLLVGGLLLLALAANELACGRLHVPRPRREAVA